MPWINSCEPESGCQRWFVFKFNSFSTQVQRFKVYESVFKCFQNEFIKIENRLNQPNFVKLFCCFSERFARVIGTFMADVHLNLQQQYMNDYPVKKMYCTIFCTIILCCIQNLFLKNAIKHDPNEAYLYFFWQYKTLFK